MRTGASGLRPALFTVEPEWGFADTLARDWLDQVDQDPGRGGDGIIIVPTARLVRNLAESFLKVGGGTSLLLPRIEAIGETASSVFDGLAPLPPTVPEMQRRAMLTRFVIAHRAKNGERLAADRAWDLAQALAAMLDDAARAEVDLASVLPKLVPEALAAHWQVTLDFLSVITKHWPRTLERIGRIDPVTRQIMLLEARAAVWQASAPAGPVWLAGFSTYTPPLGRFARTVSHLASGRVVFEMFDRTLSEVDGASLPDTHPQAGMRALLRSIGARPEEVVPIGVGRAGEAVDRAAWLGHAMRPAQSVSAWRTAPQLAPPAITLLTARDEQEEAIAVAMILRDAIKTPGLQAVLVTPDRGLARRVVTHLARFGTYVDDSAGEPLDRTPQAAFLRLIIANAMEDFSPVSLLALLKHPLAAFGMSTVETRRLARRLELCRLRGALPRPGIDGLRRQDRNAAELDPFLDRICACFAPLTELSGGAEAPPRAFAEALLSVAEMVAATSEMSGAARLWAEEEGAALAIHCAEWIEALDWLEPVTISVLLGLFEASIVDANVQGRRSLRGRAALEVHPRLSILGIVEAQGLAADLVVLGGLVEGVWPRSTDPGPWMGRNMRKLAGLPSPEAIIGAEAHAFATLCASGKRVVLSMAKRRDRTPAVPSRFVARLEACLKGAGLKLDVEPALHWARAIDRPEGPVRPCAPPTPRPPVAARPRRLSVTRIESWLVDPYAIYASEILGLKELAPLEEEVDRALIGTLVHEGLARAFCHGSIDATGIERELMAALEARSLRPGVAAWWRPRLARIATWVANTEAARRSMMGPPQTLKVEVKGTLEIAAGRAPFTLSGIADRIERGEGGISVLDYKTGMLPTKKDVLAGWHPQLLLEAEMAARGAFGPEFAGAGLAELAYWKLSGGRNEGEVRTVVETEALAAASEGAWEGLVARIGEFDDPSTPYLAEPDPARLVRFGATAALSRVQEWRISESDA